MDCDTAIWDSKGLIEIVTIVSRLVDAAIGRASAEKKKKTHPSSAAAQARIAALCCQLSWGLALSSSIMTGLQMGRAGGRKELTRQGAVRTEKGRPIRIECRIQGLKSHQKDEKNL